MKEELTQENLKAILAYDTLSGDFTWIMQPARHIKQGAIAGCVNKQRGYSYIGINGKRHLAHRLAFLYMTGNFPSLHVDHINHNRLDNSWSNLRVVTRTANQRNRSKGSNNTSGFIGVNWNKARNKWQAIIGINGKNKHLGYFNSLEEAVGVREEKTKELLFHKNHGS